MAGYKIIGQIDATVENGNADDFTVDSSFSRPREVSGSSDSATRYMKCKFGVRIAISSNLAVFASINGGWCWSNVFYNNSVSSTYGWPKSFMLAGTKWFSVRAGKQSENANSDEYLIRTSNGDFWRTYRYNSAEGSDGIYVLNDNFGVRCVSDLVSGDTTHGNEYAQTMMASSWTDPTVDPGTPGEFSKAQDVSSFAMADATWDSFRSAMAGKGFAYIGNLPDFEWDVDTTDGYVYVGGIALFNGEAPVGVEFISAAKIRISAIREYLDYYPWERKIGGRWMSLNRNGGPSSQTTTGLFRKKNGSWDPVRNTESTAAVDNEGFRKVNGTWTRSPKSGEGA